MSVILRPDFLAKPHRIPISGATPADVAHTAHSVDLIFNLAISALRGYLENLRENLPSGAVNFEDAYALMLDLHSDVIGRLENLEERGSV